ncbi:tetraspanin-3-like [Lissotriton helveticus]
MVDRPGRGCLCLLKTVSLLFWGSGGFLCYAGVSLFLTCKYFQYFFQDLYFILPSALAIAAAGILFFTGFVGCCVPTKDARCQQGTFMYFIVILLCVEASAAVLGFIYSNRIEYELRSMENVFLKYNGSSPDINSRQVDKLQKKLECCGVRNYTDWTEEPWHLHSTNRSVPESCCIKSHSNCTGDVSQPELLYQQGCQGMLHQSLQRFLKYIYWGSIGAIAVEMLAAFIDCVLMGRQSLQDYRILDSETFA